MGNKKKQIKETERGSFTRGKPNHRYKDRLFRTELYLSDSFIGQNKQATASLQCKVIMLNINLGHNKELMEKCKKLMEYAQFVDMIRRYTDRKMSFDETIDRTVKRCIQEGILRDILQKNRAEVKNVLLTEFNERLFMEGFRKEGMESATAKFNTLIQNLSKDNRLNDLEKSSRDPELQKKLFEEYGI